MLIVDSNNEIKATFKKNADESISMSRTDK